MASPEGQPSRCYQEELTHRYNNGVFPLKFGNVSVAPGHLGAVQGPKTTHHFDGALRRVGHLPRFTDGNSPQKKNKTNKVYPGCQERPWGGGEKRRPGPAVPTSGSGKGDQPSAAEQKSLFFLPTASPSSYEAMIPVDERRLAPPAAAADGASR